MIASAKSTKSDTVESIVTDERVELKAVKGE